MPERSGERDSDSPRIRKLTRRELLKYGALAGGGVVVAGALLHQLTKGPAVDVPAGFQKLELTEHRMANPAFAAKPLDDGRLLTWVRRTDDSVLAYELNPHGRLVWRLCNGRRSLDEIAAEFAQRTGRPGKEARSFAESLAEKGLVAEGGYMVASAQFPDAGGEQRYLRRLGDEHDLVE